MKFYSFINFERDVYISFSPLFGPFHFSPIICSAAVARRVFTEIFNWVYVLGVLYTGRSRGLFGQANARSREKRATAIIVLETKEEWGREREGEGRRKRTGRGRVTCEPLS